MLLTPSIVAKTAENGLQIAVEHSSIDIRAIETPLNVTSQGN